MGRIGDRMLQIPDYDNHELTVHVSSELLGFMRGTNPEYCFPPSISPEEGFREWNSLTKLLESEVCYIPELPMEYIMFHLINNALDEDYELPPLPAEAKVGLDPDEIEMFECLEDWLEVLFWDWDFMLLDEMNEEELLNHPLARELGIGSPNETRFDIDGTEIRFRNRPWEME